MAQTALRGNEATSEILAAVVTTNGCHDSEVFPDLLAATAAEMEQVSADGAYDKRRCYDAVTEDEIRPAIPPQKNAEIWQHGNCQAPLHPRDENLRAIRRQGVSLGNESRTTAAALSPRRRCIA